jgi:hypothetical protein
MHNHIEPLEMVIFTSYFSFYSKIQRERFANNLLFVSKAQTKTIILLLFIVFTMQYTLATKLKNLGRKSNMSPSSKNTK